MVIVVDMTFNGSAATSENYDKVLAALGFTSGGTGAPGGLFHTCVVGHEQLRIVDVWQSRQEFEDFAASQLGPVTARLGLPSPSNVTITPAHAYLTAKN